MYFSEEPFHQNVLMCCYLGRGHTHPELTILLMYIILGLILGGKKSSCSGTIFMLNACGFNESSMCKYSSNLCHNTYVRTIRWLILSHYYKLFVSGYKQVDSLEITGVV